MLDLRFVVENKDKVEAALAKRAGGKAWLGMISEIIELDKKRRDGLQKVETLKARRNNASQEIAKLKKEKGDATAIMDEMKLVSHQIKEGDEGVEAIQADLHRRLLEIPNLPDESVPAGKDAAENKIVKTWGEPKKFSFTPKTHDEIGEKLGLMDFKKAGEVTGARFVFMKGRAAKLERALINFMLDTHASRGYEEMIPPLMVNRNALIGTGQLPKFEEDVFHIEKFGYFLIPTAEVPLTNYHREEILDEKFLTKKYCAYTPCFRSEAGSYGKDTKGLKRQHQFNKIELVKFATPQTSFAEHETLLQDSAHILEKLGIPYRVALLCGGDMGFGSAKTYDIEVWCPGANSYMEISSCSNFTEYQARRASIRYRDAHGKVHFVHTLNSSGVAVGRALIAILENYQTADGDFEVPDVLKEYL